LDVKPTVSPVVPYSAVRWR